MFDDETTTPSPDDAFGALSFSALYDRVGVDDTGGFNYHLDKPVGHFVREADKGYELARPGSRVVETVLSGAVTETPVLELTVDDPVDVLETVERTTVAGD